MNRLSDRQWIGVGLTVGSLIAGFAGAGAGLCILAFVVGLFVLNE